MHRMAFASSGGQRIIAEMEDQLYRAELRGIENRRPVFVTALPRAGTTLLLEILASLDEFASHSYRNMPFVLCPLLWKKMSARHQRSGIRQERAHGDGMTVDIDSPEAFEEMVWMPFWKDHYGRDRIYPWLETDPEFFEFLDSHMKKIILLAAREDATGHRYLSKNNLNIARMSILPGEFDDATFIVPFRSPLQHCVSLLRQHKNFLELHRTDAFARRYMAGIGHFDFGENFRPVDFDGWLERRSSADATTLGFWIEYWVAAYAHLAKNASITLVCYEDLCTDPAGGLAALADTLAIRDRAAFASQSSRFRPPQPRPVDTEPGSGPLVEKAEDLYAMLRDRALTSATAGA